MADDMTKVTDPTDPNRCQASAGSSQCMNKVMTGTGYCKAHGGALAAARNEKAAINRFYKTKFYDAIKDEYDQASLKSLHGEVAVLKMLLTNLLGQIKDPQDLMMRTTAVSDLITKTEKTISACHKLDKELNLLVDQAAVMTFATKICDIVMAELDNDKVKLNSISMKIAVAFQELVQHTGEEI